MDFISYAQNFEDVMLWRALHDVQIGFYIDVGAQDPHKDSVTKAFYERGWRGINIEPIPQWHLRLEESRERDINLNVAAASTEGEITIYEIPDTGLSTVDLEVAKTQNEKYGFDYFEIQVKARTLTDICLEFHETPIHFLKIDVEGAENQVLQGIDLNRIRPWIIIIEATKPGTQEADFEEWEPNLLDADYDFVYFDGLNRFYVATENSTLKNHFNTPPNVFDQFVLASEQLAKQRAEDVQEKIEQINSELTQIKRTRDDLDQNLSDALSRAQKWEIEYRNAEGSLRKLQEQNQGLTTQLDSAESRLVQLEGQNQGITKHLESVEEKKEAIQKRVIEIEGDVEKWKSLAENQSHQLSLVLRSRSWRMTHPLRVLRKAQRNATAVLASVLSDIWKWITGVIKSGLRQPIKFILKRPHLRKPVGILIGRFPRLDAYIRRALAPFDTQSAPPPAPTPDPQKVSMVVSTLPADLSESANAVYRDLVEAISAHLERS